MINEELIKKLVIQVEKAVDNNEIPVGALIVDKMGNIISESCNNRQNSYSVIGHAEINAILGAEKKIKDWRLDGYDLIVNLEPCEMCSVIIKESRIDNVYYFVESNDKKSNLSNLIKIEDYPQYTKQFINIIKDYFKSKR